jgi:hypothetical protein
MFSFFENSDFIPTIFFFILFQYLQEFPNYWCQRPKNCQILAGDLTTVQFEPSRHHKT